MDDIAAELHSLMNRLAASGSDGSVELLLDQMEPESARHLKLCAIPHHFNAQVMLALDPGLDLQHAELRCEEFSSLSVIIPNQTHLALHEDVRQYLFAQWIGPPTSSEFIAASSRLVNYFAQYVATVEGKAKEILQGARMFHLLGAEKAEGIAEFERLFRQMRKDFRLGECENIIRLVHEYDSVLAREHTALLMYHEGELATDYCQWELAEQTFKRILQSDAADAKLRAKAHNRLGLICAEHQDWYMAIKHYEAALDLAHAAADSRRLVYRLLHDLGVAYRECGNDWMKSRKMLTDSIRLAKEENDLTAIAMGYNSLGTLYRKISRNHQAISAYQKSLKYLESAQDKFRPAQIYNNLGLIYTDFAKWKKSQQFFEQSLEIKQQAGDTLGQAKTLTNLARVYQNRKKYKQAVGAAKEAIRLFEEMRESYGAALARRNLAKLYRRLEKRELAVQVLKESVEAFEQSNYSEEAAAARRDLAAITAKGGLPWWVILIIQIFLILLIVIALVLLLR